MHTAAWIKALSPGRRLLGAALVCAGVGPRGACVAAGSSVAGGRADDWVLAFGGGSVWLQ